MSPMHRTLATLGACAVVSVSIAACSSSGGSSASSSGSASSGSKSSPVKILAVVDTSGPNKSVGVPELSGIQAGAAYVNAHGGILGRKVQVTVADDNGDPTTADTAVIQALSSNPTEYSMIWGGEEGTETSALIPVIKRYKAYAIAINDGTNLCQNASNCPTEFTLTGSSQIPEEAQAAWFKSHGYKNVGILDEGIAFTQTEATDLAADLAKDGIKTETESFPTSAVSVTPEMSALKSGGAQAVYAAMFGPPEGYILNARPELGWQVPVLFESAGSSLDISTLAPASEMTDAYETPFYCGDRVAQRSRTCAHSEVRQRQRVASVQLLGPGMGRRTAPACGCDEGRLARSERSDDGDSVAQRDHIRRHGLPDGVLLQVHGSRERLLHASRLSGRAGRSNLDRTAPSGRLTRAPARSLHATSHRLSAMISRSRTAAAVCDFAAVVAG